VAQLLIDGELGTTVSELSDLLAGPGDHLELPSVVVAGVLIQEGGGEWVDRERTDGIDQRLESVFGEAAWTLAGDLKGEAQGC
jgi:hypothetical protein